MKLKIKSFILSTLLIVITLGLSLTAFGNALLHGAGAGGG